MVGLFGAARDVTAQREAEAAQRELSEQLRQQAESLSAILSAAVDHIYLIDREGRYRYVSVGAARGLGCNPGDMIGKRLRELGLPAEVMEPFDAQREQVFTTGEALLHEGSFRPAGGAMRHYETMVAPVRR